MGFPGGTIGKEPSCQEEVMTDHFSILAWRSPWTEEPGRLRTVGLQSLTKLKRLRTHTWSKYYILIPPFAPKYALRWLVVFKGLFWETLWLDLHFTNCILITSRLFPVFCYTNCCDVVLHSDILRIYVLHWILAVMCLAWIIEFAFLSSFSPS